MLDIGELSQFIIYIIIYYLDGCDLRYFIKKIPTYFQFFEEKTTPLTCLMNPIIQTNQCNWYGFVWLIGLLDLCWSNKFEWNKISMTLDGEQ